MSNVELFLVFVAVATVLVTGVTVGALVLAARLNRKEGR